jgi:Trypsin
MHRSRTLGYLLCAISMGCGGNVDSQPALERRAQPIVRGEETEAFPQIVMLHVQLSTQNIRCTGSYIAPRVVLTAAHCIRPGAIPLASYVYYGEGEAPAPGVPPEIPVPGQPSDLARVETFRVHPDYNPGLNYPDLAIAYLDRELPFAPLPLLKERIGRRSIGAPATIVGWGGSRSLVPDISQVEGAGFKRRGRVTILGTPTEADFHEDDPNPGMLDPAIRADSLETDGTAPTSNGCAGDSGGPLLIEKEGRTYVAGVGYWTGLWCEDYSIFARIDPFLGFIEEAVHAAGRERILPRLECVDRAEDGTYTAFFGYENQNGISLEIPHSSRNSLRADDAGVRPELFGPGDNPWVFSLEFDRRERLSYRLVSPKGSSSVATANRNSPRCDCAAACEAALAAECSDGSFTRSQCVAECAPFHQLFPGCQAELNAYWQCMAALPPAAENWICDPAFIPQPVSCQEEFFNALGCAGYL